MPRVRRSRSAAYAKQARTSSRVSCGKSVRTWSSDIPPARYPRISPTLIRVPRTQGFPNRTSGVIVMRSNELMRQVYGNHLAGRKTVVLVRRLRSLSAQRQGITSGASEFTRAPSGACRVRPLLVPLKQHLRKRAAIQSELAKDIGNVSLPLQFEFTLLDGQYDRRRQPAEMLNDCIKQRDAERVPWQRRKHGEPIAAIG